jgi:hypothetical protein
MIRPLSVSLPSTGDLVLILLYNEGFHRFYYIGNCVRVVNRSYGPVLILVRKKDRSRLRIPLCSPSLIGYRILRPRVRVFLRSPA